MSVSVSQRFLARPLQRLRGGLITPAATVATFERRGFHPGAEPDRRALEAAGTTFLSGLRSATSGTGVDRLGDTLTGSVPRERQGFAFEGAAMGLALLDAVGPRHDRVAGLLKTSGAAHTYMVHVGAGWALARLPRPLWRHAVPTDPLLRWLALDGYGFHEAYFRTPARADGRWSARLPGWPGPPDAVANVVDQGIGRALWFVECADPERIAARLRGFARGATPICGPGWDWRPSTRRRAPTRRCGCWSRRRASTSPAAAGRGLRRGGPDARRTDHRPHRARRAGAVRCGRPYRGGGHP